ncbi:MAG: hypothetical protein JJLCMIEE_01449 [Acidimicrobiales bacterium]|nr:MAG: CAP domain-containing protein [Actinomycetota bacterium]MBV6508389.1 hypothetical protein [Acidimicrobiales bacterium]RIK04797.1 MAG: hypothetical protein DCC48_12180 [Acidobacteriota bacterium]
MFGVLRRHSASTGEREEPAARKHRLACWLVVLSVLGIALTSCETTRAERDYVIGLINQSRAAYGIHPLIENGELDMKAERWAQHLRDTCSLYHSHLPDGISYYWLKLGENVGYGGSIGTIHNAYMASSGHRANILDPAFRYVGAASVKGYCGGYLRTYTVQVFMRL